jgi:hypothetical protein
MAGCCHGALHSELKNTGITGTVPASVCPVLNALVRCDLSAVNFECPFPAACTDVATKCGAVCTSTTTTTTTTPYTCAQVDVDCNNVPLASCSLAVCANEQSM